MNQKYAFFQIVFNLFQIFFLWWIYNAHITFLILFKTVYHMTIISFTFQKEVNFKYCKNQKTPCTWLRNRIKANLNRLGLGFLWYLLEMLNSFKKISSKSWNSFFKYSKMKLNSLKLVNSFLTSYKLVNFKTSFYFI